MTGRRGLIDDCFRPDAPAMRHDAALGLLRDRLGRVAGTEHLPLDQASGRVLDQDIRAPRPIPFADNAAVDGYAFAHADLAETGGRMAVTLRIAAGHPSQRPLGQGQAARIFTGAAMPSGADTVAMQEDCATEDGFVQLPLGLKPGANRRRAGEDMPAGALLMGPGTRLRPQELAAIASTGLDEVAVTRPLRVAYLSTGDELRRPGQTLQPGQVYDSNAAMLAGLLARPWVAFRDHGVVPDRAEAVEWALRDAAAGHDVVITTGGASRGEEDHVAHAIERLGQRHLWHLAVKPGRPMSLGQIGDCVMLGLPGNPVASFVSFLLYGLPVLERLSGAAWREPRRYPIPAGFSVPARKTGRREFYRGILTGSGSTLAVEKYARDGSGLITGLREADGLIEIPEEVELIRRGEPVLFMPFSEFG